jgi:hypothetical protein
MSTWPLYAAINSGVFSKASIESIAARASSNWRAAGASPQKAARNSAIATLSCPFTSRRRDRRRNGCWRRDLFWQMPGEPRVDRSNHYFLLV